MTDRDHARALLARAEDDLKALRGMTDPAVFADAIVGFHAQQTAEKALKAWLAVGGVAYPFTHDLNLLLGMLADKGDAVEPYRPLVRLNAFAVFYRYEALGADVPLGDREAMTDEVASLVEHVRAVLG